MTGAAMGRLHLPMHIEMLVDNVLMLYKLKMRHALIGGYCLVHVLAAGTKRSLNSVK
jgi:hypothetical protein